MTAEAPVTELDPLTRLAIRHGTDKWGQHFYTPIYHRLLEHLRDRPIRLLEIGVGGYGWRAAGGASLTMWAEYFPRGEIFGFDIVDKRLDLGPRITIRCGSQADAAFLVALCDELGPFDIVIDDGSHQPEHVAISFDVLLPRMANEGIYIIEDVQTGYWSAFSGGDRDGGATVRLATMVLSHLNHAEIETVEPAEKAPPVARQIRALHAYHNLIVIEKGDNSEPSNFSYRLDNPHAAHALATMGHELERAPTPGGLANLAMLLFAAGERTRAEKILVDALATWPESTALLTAGIEVLSETPKRLALLDRLARIEGEASAGLVERVRVAIGRGESTVPVVTALDTP